MPQIADVEGIGPAFGAKLESAGVKTTDALLERAAKSKGRHDLAQATGIREKLLLDWVNRVDLARIKGVGSSTQTCSRQPVWTHPPNWHNVCRHIF
jgi:hypothetical protein